MVSKENQEALEHIACYCSNYHSLSNDFDTLQQAIDKLEVIEKALNKTCLRLADISVEGDKENDYQVVNQAEVFKEEILEQARKELENE